MLMISTWNKKEMPVEGKKLVTVPLFQKGNKTYCNNYKGISLSPTTYKISTNILLSRLTPYAGEIIRDHQMMSTSVIRQ
jgi:hypothetical protein